MNETTLYVGLVATMMVGGCVNTCPESERYVDGRCQAVSVDAAIDGNVSDAGDAGRLDASDGGGDDLGDDLGTDAGPCGMECPVGTLVCDATSGACVECTAGDATACTGGTPVCDVATNSCVQCTAGDAAACTGGTPVCDTVANVCVACNVDADCTSLATAQCDTATHMCVPCTADAACAGRGGRSVCGAGTCVECTSTDRSACATGICLVSASACAPTGGATPLCSVCATDDECQPGMVCSPMTFDDPNTPAADPVAVARHCLYREDATGPGAPDADCVSLRPYVASTPVTSAGGLSVNVCALRASTCEAHAGFSLIDCMTIDAAGNARCGVTALNDGVCQAFGAVARLCTVYCVSDLDCPGTTCAPGATPRVCRF